MPWWPTSSSALTYRILNPNASVTPTYSITNDSIFSDYLGEWATANAVNLLQGIGQSPTEWEGIHVWYVSLDTSLPQIRIVIRRHVDIASKNLCTTRRKCICYHERSIADLDSCAATKATTPGS